MATTATVAPTQDATLAERTRSRITRRLAPFLFVLYILNYLDRVNVSFASLQMTGELHFSNSVFGFGPALLHVFPFLTGVLPELGQTLFRPFPNIAACLLYVFQAVPYAFSEGRQTFPQQLSSFGSRLRRGQ